MRSRKENRIAVLMIVVTARHRVCHRTGQGRSPQEHQEIGVRRTCIALQERRFPSAEHLDQSYPRGAEHRRVHKGTVRSTGQAILRAFTQTGVESVSIVTEGTRMTFELAKDIAAEATKRQTPYGSTAVRTARSCSIAPRTIGAIHSRQVLGPSKRTFGARERAGSAVVQGGQAAGEAMSGTGTRQGTAMASGSVSLAKEISLTSAERSGSTLAFAGNTFVKGYAAVPANLRKRASGFGESLSEAKLAGIVKEENKTRSGLSQKTIDLMADTKDYLRCRDNLRQGRQGIRRKLHDDRAQPRYGKVSALGPSRNLLGRHDRTGHEVDCSLLGIYWREPGGVPVHGRGT